tara:strand:+ start:405 stop:938 length:534 start_codon:yes stop_codon:yes gene_type:complete
MKKIIITLMLLVSAFVSSGHEISVGYVVDPSYTEQTNYHELTRFLNITYKPAGITFKCEEVFYKKNPVPTYNLNKLCIYTNQADDAKDITVCVVGKHEGNEIGQAPLEGFFYQKSIAYVDLSFTRNIQGKSNMVAHEIGHLLGLDHCPDGTLMQEYHCNHAVKLSESHLKKLKKIRF